MTQKGTIGRILVVDDHADLAENIAEILEGVGHPTAIATSAEAALARIAAGDIIALVTDYRLPGRSGAELIRELRKQGNGIPALVMSAYTDDVTIGRAEGAGALEVLAKPVSIERLIALVEEMGRDDSTVLIVDDNRPLAENLAEALRGRGYRAVVTTTAAEAISGRQRVRAAILDYRLPDGTGLDVAARLRARDPATRVLFVSGHEDELRGQLGSMAGAVDTMGKPVDVAQLIDWVARALGHGTTTRTDR